MLYGLLTEFGFEYCNFGDYAQTIAIEHLYEHMNIPKNKIVHLTQRELATYDGESLLLPFNYALTYIMNKETERVELSEKITPVFLGATIGVGFTRPLSVFTDPGKGWNRFFMRFAPIGCRDEFTRNFLSSSGIPAYLQGCITNIFPQRPVGNYSKILLVDCPLEVLPYIPKALLSKAETMSNEEYTGTLSLENLDENYNKIKQRYQYYRDNAALILTSRYHVATPCNAMGIPSVMIMRPSTGKEHSKDIRLDSLHPNIQLCQGWDFDSIDWNQKWKTHISIKANITEIAVSRLHGAYELISRVPRLREDFQSRIDNFNHLEPKDEHIKKNLSDFVRNNFGNSTEGQFYIWAASALLCNGDYVPLASLIQQTNPKLSFKGWLDSYKSGMLANKPIFNPYEIELNENEFIVVATETIIPTALQYFKKIGLTSRQYAVYASTYITEMSLNDYKL